MPPRKKTTLSQGTNTEQTEPNCCVDTCTHDRMVIEDIQMISCIQCDISYHYECIGMEEDNDNIWLCSQCKLLPTRMRKLQESVDMLIKLNEQILKNVKINTDKIGTIEVDHVVMSETVKDTFDTVTEINTTVKGLSKEQAALAPAIMKMNMISHKELYNKKKCLLLGDSLVQKMQKTSEDIQITTMKSVKI